MNYLAHAYFSGDNEAVLVGNMMGDFVKGSSVLDSYPSSIRAGLELHRAIDTFADQHMAVAKAKNFFRNEYRLYSGAFVDVAFDHFFANDPKYFPLEKDHKDFTLQVFETLNRHHAELHPTFAHILQYMELDNWLYTIRSMKGLERAFERLVKRMAYENDGSMAYKISVQHYYELNQVYYEFIDDFDQYVKATLSSLLSGK